MTRDWENWDVGGAARNIQTIWQESESELAHRRQLVDLVSRNIEGSQLSILEVGCGTGLIYERLVDNLEADMTYTGVDSSINMLQIARNDFPNGHFIFGDGYELVFRNQEFDLVLCFEVLGHIPQIVPFVSELFRVSNQTCIFTTWPSHSDDVIEGEEIVDGVSFLQRRYPDAYIQKIIRAAGHEKLGSIETSDLASGGKAYIVKFRHQ